MIGSKEAFDIIQDRFPERFATGCREAADKFIFTMVNNPDKVSYNNPIYAVSKETGEVSGYSPTSNLQEWISARDVDIQSLY